MQTNMEKYLDVYIVIADYVSTIGQLMDIGSEIAYNKLRNDCDYQTCEDGIIESIDNLVNIHKVHILNDYDD